jgi:DNA-binding NarL/FixJ family response regulator
MSPNQIRVLCVDDHPLVLEGIIRKIDLQADTKVIAAVHVRNLFSKLGVHERTTAVRVAAQRGIIHLD